MDLKQEVQTRYILHWNYREYPQFPQELLTYGRNIEQIYYKENDNDHRSQQVNQRGCSEKI